MEVTVSCGRGLCHALLTAVTPHGTSAQMIPRSPLPHTATVWRRNTALNEIPEEMAGEKHVDPGVAAAVEAGKKHGDDKCQGWQGQDKK